MGLKILSQIGGWISKRLKCYCSFILYKESIDCDFNVLPVVIGEMVSYGINEFIRDIGALK